MELRKSLKSMSVEDHKAMKIIENTISKVDGHYQIGLLGKQEDPDLPFNRVAAQARLHHLKRHFSRDPDLEAKYRAVIEEYVNKGYARKLTPEEATKRSRITWYLLHHPIFNINKPDKCHVVFDAAAKSDGTSLNDQLFQGPDLTNSLTGVLIRFPEEEIAFTADLEAMFHRVKVLPRDADALRFLWWSGSLDNPPPDEYQMLVHIFGAASSPCCANRAVRQTVDDNEEQFGPEVINTVCRNFYFDDVLKSVPNEENVIHLTEQLIQLMKEGGFHLTKFTSNSHKLLATLPEKERANPALNLDLDQLHIGRALGLHWDTVSDTFLFKVTHTNKPPTKCGILSTVSSLFDPLGFMGPFILPVKVLLQELRRMGIQWDKRVPEPLLTQWHRWMESLPLVAKIKIPRCFRNASRATTTNVQLHYFSDSSNRGYGAVSYLRLVDDQGRVHHTFVMGKTCNTPLKQWSIPCLELQAAVVSRRLHVLIPDELDLPVHSVTFWTDSLTVLQYISNEKRRFKPFVANRVNEIHDTSTPEQWRHEPTSLNPANEGSWGMEIHSLKPNCHWLSGPKFLLQPEDHWPVQEIGNIPDNDKEI